MGFKGIVLSLFLAMVTTSYAASPEQGVTSHHPGQTILRIPLDDNASVLFWKPDRTTIPLSLSSGQVRLPKTGVDNYHVVVAEQDIGHLKKAFIRYVFRYGKPSGHSTRDVVNANKTELEIIPDPIPREHDHYYSQQNWSFRIRFQGQPLAHCVVKLHTENGTHLQQVTDKYGRVTFTLPDDFPHVVAGRRDKRTVTMTLVVRHQIGSHQWQTIFMSDYAVNPAHWQFTSWGGWVMLIGMVLGRVIVRLNRKRNSGEKV